MDANRTILQIELSESRGATLKGKRKNPSIMVYTSSAHESTRSECSCTQTAETRALLVSLSDKVVFLQLRRETVEMVDWRRPNGSLARLAVPMVEPQ